MILPLLYSSLAVFLAGNIVRFVQIAKMPAHLRWELYPIPRGSRGEAGYGASYMEETEWWTRSRRPDRAAELRVILGEVFLLKGVWKHNRPLWVWSWLLHTALYLLIATFGIAGLVSVLEHESPSSISTLESLFRVSGNDVVRLLMWVFSAAGSAGSAGLIAVRLASPRLRRFTSTSFFLNLSVLFLIFTTAGISLFTDPGAARNAVSLAGALVRLNPAPGLTPVETGHVAVLSLFVLYFPFTHMTHMFLKFFTFHRIRWDDAPLRGNRSLELDVARSLNARVTWSAPHIRGMGTKNWTEIAAEGNIDGPEGPQN